MRNATQLITGRDYSQPLSAEATQSRRPASADQTAVVVNHLFSSLQVAFPAWRTSFRTDAELDTAKQVWIKAFHENGINSQEQIAEGMRQARKSTNPWWPAVGEFVAWCKLGQTRQFPSVEAAYLEACNNAGMKGRVYSHTAVQVAAAKVGSAKLRSQPRREIFPVFSEFYAATCARVLAGDEIAADIAPKHPELAANYAPAPSGTRLLPGRNDRAAGQAALNNLKALFAKATA